MPIAAAVTAHMIITKPVETLFRSGMNVKQQLKSADISTTAVTVGDFFMGGMNIAINMPYIATPRADWTIAGRILPITAPSRVPSAQPR